MNNTGFMTKVTLINMWLKFIRIRKAGTKTPVRQPLESIYQTIAAVYSDFTFKIILDE